jgi:endonuclease/exonuclease/phosphatase family metal-dependent hydrolase
MPNNHSLVVYNTHCSAYDTAGTMVQAEVKKMIEDAELEYLNGNYVIMGGDWNQCPPNYSPINPDSPYNENLLTNGQIPHEWRWIADPTVPTNRKLTKKYVKGETYTTVIDHYMVSPNLEVIKAQGQDLNFKFSDHQPVLLEVRPIYDMAPIDSLGQGPGTSPNTLKFITPDLN